MARGIQENILWLQGIENDMPVFMQVSQYADQLRRIESRLVGIKLPLSLQMVKKVSAAGQWRK
jgi:hypothetical protein